MFDSGVRLSPLSGTPVNDAVNAFAAFSVLLIPAGILLAPDLAETVFYLLALLGLVEVARRRPLLHGFSPLLLLSLLTVGFFAVTLLALPASGDVTGGIARLDRFAHFLVAPFFAAALQRANPGAPRLLAAVKFSALLVGAVAVAQWMNGSARAGGAVNPLLFGALSLLLAFFSLARVPLESAWQKAFSTLAFCAGAGACVLSQSRGVWLEAAGLLVAIVWLWQRAGLLSKPLLFGIGALCCAMVSLSCATSLLQDRLGEALTDYRNFHAGTEWDNSVALRLIMWRSALQAAKQRPLLGWGMHRTPYAAASVIDNPAAARKVVQYSHLHNEYLTTLVGKGLPGIVSLMLLLLASLRLFMKHAGRPECLVYTAFGVLLCAGYLLSGLTNLAFGHDVMNIFFITVLSLTLPRLSQRRGDYGGA